MHVELSIVVGPQPDALTDLPILQVDKQVDAFSLL